MLKIIENETARWWTFSGNTVSKRRRSVLKCWNQLANAKAFSLMCGYAMGNFYKDANFDEIFSRHTHVISPDGRRRLLHKRAMISGRPRAKPATRHHRRHRQRAGTRLAIERSPPVGRTFFRCVDPP